MGMLDRFEKGLEGAVNRAFAKAFKSEVQPVEIASALRKEIDDRAVLVSRDRVLAPNTFVVELGPEDFTRLGEWQEALADELVTSVREHAVAQRYTFLGPVTVEFSHADDLETGVFRVVSGTRRGVPDIASAHHDEQAYYPDPLDTPRSQAAVGAPPGQYAPDQYAPDQYAPDQYAADHAPEQYSRQQADDPFAFFAPTDSPAAGLPAAAPPVGFPAPAAPVPPAPPLFPPAAAPAAGAGAGHLLGFDEREQAPRGQGGDGYAVLELDGRELPLTSPVTVIGRSSEADLTLDDPGISRRHAEIHVLDGRPRIVDLGSTNGTYVDGARVHACPLADGSVITVGRTRIVVRLGRW